ncbi:MAG: hypothetical protein ACRENX_11135 [Candidatus Dormibacteria bacterium]
MIERLIEAGPSAFVLGVALKVGADEAAGDTRARTVLNAAGLVVGGAGRGHFGCSICGVEAIETAVGLAACPVLVVGSSVGGAEPGAALGNWLADRGGW